MGGASVWLEETKDAIRMSDTFGDDVKTEMQSLWNSYEAVDTVLPQQVQRAITRSSSLSGEYECMLRCEELASLYQGQGWEFMQLSSAQYIFSAAGFSDHYDGMVYSAEQNGSPADCTVIGINRSAIINQVGPLLSTEWHQDMPFNALVPNDRPAGCGAIAVAQVMKYYEYPQTITYNGYTFDWSTIPADYTGLQQRADHEFLVKRIGDAVNMHYMFFGSWATPNAMETGIRSLGYNVTRSNHNFNTVRSNLFNQKPVIMGGNADNVPLPSPLDYIGTSHYWVCDGVEDRTLNQIRYFMEWQPGGNGVFTNGWYSVDSPGQIGGVGYLYFHMKWGWEDGWRDGWFAYDNVNSGSGNYRYAREDFYITKP